MWPHEAFCARRVKIDKGGAALCDFATAFPLLHEAIDEAQGVSWDPYASAALGDNRDMACQLFAAALRECHQACAL